LNYDKPIWRISFGAFMSLPPQHMSKAPRTLQFADIQS